MEKESIKPIVLTNRDQVKNTLVYFLLFFSMVILNLIFYVIFDYYPKFLFLAGLTFAFAIWSIVKSVKVKNSMPYVIEFIRIDENGIRIKDKKEWLIPWQQIRSVTFYNRYRDCAGLHVGIDYERNEVASLRIDLQPYYDILNFRKWKRAIDFYSGRDDIVTNKHLKKARLEADDYNSYSSQNRKK